MNRIFNFQFSIFKQGQAALVAVMMFLFISLLISIGLTSPVTRQAGIANELKSSQTAFLAAEAAEEDVAYRIRTGKTFSATEVMRLNDATATTTTEYDPGGQIVFSKELLTVAESRRAIRKKYMILSIADRVMFRYAAQAGAGGFYLKNTSSVKGNIYSNGVVDGFNDSVVEGTAVSAGAAGLADELYVIGSARAHTINDSTIFADAYYQTILGSIVFGNQYPGSPDPKSKPFPISDEIIDEWQAAAEAGGVINSPCPYVLQGNVTIGPIKINCDLEIKGASTVVTLTGHLWAVGDVTITNASRIQIDSGLIPKSVVIIANDPTNQISKSIVKLRNSMLFQGGGPTSFIILISRNRDVLAGGSTFGIQFEQTAIGDAVLYSNHGGIFIANASELAQVTGYKIELRNNTQLIYDSGLLDLYFDAGPGGSWSVVEWKEIE